MQTRRLRLGDVVDDYCPRERRLSNHVVVAMVDDAIKQTRCSTCDFEHPYKDGKLPARRKKKDATAVLYQQVLEGMTEKPPSAPVIVEERPIERPVERAVAAEPQARGEVLAMAAGASAPVTVPAPASASTRPTAPNLRTRTSKAKAAAAAAAAAATPAPEAPPTPPTPPVRIAPPSGEAPRLAVPAPPPAPVVARPAPVARADQADAADQVDDEGEPVPGGENEPLHRRTLIRAQLPRPVGEVPTRQAPTFTIREAARAPKFRRPFARNARPQGGQNGLGTGPMGRAAGARNGQQPRGKKGGASQQGAHRFGQGQSHGQGGHHAKGRQGNQGNKRFK